MSERPGSDDPAARGRLDAMLGGAHPDSGHDADHDEPPARRTTPPARWIPFVVAAVIGTVAVIGGVAWLAGRDSDAPGEPGAGATTDPGGGTSTEPSTAPGRTATVQAYYVGETAAGPRLFREEHTVEDAADDDLEVAVAEAVNGRPVDPDYSRWAVGAPAATARNSGSVVIVDLDGPAGRPEGMDEDQALAAVQAVVWTAGAAVGEPVPVSFTVRGEPTDEVLGIDTSEPVERMSADDILATVSIDAPAQGAEVDSPFEVRGQAATFEANVVWELKQGDTVVAEGFTTAQECCTLAPYSFMVEAPPGQYTLHVHDTDMSDGEGIGTSEDTKDVTIR